MTVVKTIGTGSGIGTPDYATINLWDAYLNALGTFTEDQVGRVLWASSANELTVNDTLDGSTPSTFNIILEAGDSAGNQGGSFRNHADKLTNPLRYDASKGSALLLSASDSRLNMSDAKITVRNLQFKKVHNYNYMFDLLSADNDRVIDSCIVEWDTTGAAADFIAARGTLTVQNSLFLLRQTNSSNTDVIVVVNGGTATIHNCTFVCTDSGVTAGVGMRTAAGGDTINAKNVAIYGWGL